MAELLHPFRINGERAKQTGFFQHGVFTVGEQLGEGVATIEVLGIPLLGFFECRRLAQGLFLGAYIGLREAFLTDGLAVIGIVDVVEQQAHRGAVDDEVMIVDEEIEVVVVAKQMDAEQTIVVDVEGSHQLGCFLLDVVGVFDFQFPLLVVHVDGLYGLTLVGEFYPCEQGGVCLDGVKDGDAKPFFVERLVECV